MNINYKTKGITLVVLLISLTGLWYLLKTMPTNDTFECHARVKRQVIKNECGSNSTFDIFLSMTKGKGYFLVSGSHTCPKTELKSIHQIVSFNYNREGSYVAMNFAPRDPDVVEMFDMFKEDRLLLKITHAKGNGFILSTPVETLMLCTAE